MPHSTDPPPFHLALILLLGPPGPRLHRLTEMLISTYHLHVTDPDHLQDTWAQQRGALLINPASAHTTLSSAYHTHGRVHVLHLPGPTVQAEHQAIMDALPVKTTIEAHAPDERISLYARRVLASHLNLHATVMN